MEKIMTTDPTDSRWAATHRGSFDTLNIGPLVIGQRYFPDCVRAPEPLRFPVSGVSHLEYFATRLETESLLKFKYDAERDLATSLSI